MLSGVEGDAPQLGAPPPAKLWHNRDFNRLWLSQTISGLGDMFGLIAMPMLVLQTTGSVAEMGRVTAAYSIGQFLACISCGALVDRTDRRQLMLWCDVWRGIGHSIVPIVWVTSGPQIWLLYVTTVVGAFLGATFQIASTSAVTRLVRQDQLTDANGRMQASYGLTSFFGPMLAGLVALQFGPEVAVGLNGGSFFLSAICLCMVRRHVLARRMEQPDGDVLPRRQGFVAGMRFILKHPILKWMLAFSIWLTTAAAVGIDLFVYRLQHEMAEDQSTVGLVFALAALGSVAGAVVAPALRRRFGFPVSYLTSIAIQGAAMAFVGMSGALLTLIVAAVVYSAGQMTSRINSISIRQELIPEGMLGQITAVFWCLTVAPAPFSIALFTSIAGDIGTGPVLVALGGGLAALAALGIATPLRSVDSRPSTRRTSHVRRRHES